MTLTSILDVLHSTAQSRDEPPIAQPPGRPGLQEPQELQGRLAGISCGEVGQVGVAVVLLVLLLKVLAFLVVAVVMVLDFLTPLQQILLVFELAMDLFATEDPSPAVSAEAQT